MIKLHSDLPIEDFSRTIKAKCFDHKLLNHLPPGLVLGAVCYQFRTGWIVVKTCSFHMGVKPDDRDARRRQKSLYKLLVADISSQAFCLTL